MPAIGFMTGPSAPGSRGTNAVDQGADPHLSGIAHQVLELLFRSWPAPCDLDLASFALAGEAGARELLAAMEGLRDRGYVMYEAVAARPGALRFRDALITPNGRAALRAGEGTTESGVNLV